jgi:Domain of unknown function (DUF5667)
MSNMLPRPKPRDAFKRSLRAQLMAQAPSLLSPEETMWTRVTGGFLRPAFRPAMVAAAIALLVVGGAGKAAADSLPGDAAFGLKVAAEQLQLSLALDDTTRLRLLAEQADHRLAELAEAVSTRPEAAPTATDAYAAAVQRFTDAVDALQGKPGTSVDKQTAADDVVDAAHAKHEAVLDELEKTAPASAQQGLERARQEADKLHPSGRPARTLEPTDTPEPTKSSDRTAAPTRAAEPTRTAAPTRLPDNVQERSFSPAPTDHR